MSAALIAILAAHSQRVIQHFLTAGATTPARAIAMDTLPPEFSGYVATLRRRGLVRSNAEGELYLDTQRLAEQRGLGQQVSRYVVITVLTAVVLVTLALFAAQH